MTVLVTGASGFIGSRLAGHLGSGDVLTDVVTSKKVKKLDVLDAAETAEVISGYWPDVVVHLAGPVVGHARKKPADAVRLQVEGTLNVLQACREVGAKVVLASSFYVYDGIDQDSVVWEGTELNLMVPETFGAAKLMAERLVADYGTAYGLEWMVLRFGSAYGPGEGSNVISDFVKMGESEQVVEIWGSGNRANQYTHVDDIVAGILMACEHSGEVWNLISPERTSTRELAETMSNMFGFEFVFNTEKPEGPSMPTMLPIVARRRGWSARPLVEGLKLL